MPQPSPLPNPVDGTEFQQPPPPSLPVPVARHRSLNCRVRCSLLLRNATRRTVRVLWLDYRGAAKCFYELLPGVSGLLHTYTAHPWRFEDPEDPDALLVAACYEGAEEAQLDLPVFYCPERPPIPPNIVYQPQLMVCVEVREARRVPWSTVMHAHAPVDFKGQAAALLRCHCRLSRPLAQGRLLDGETRCTLGDLPQELVLLVLAALAPPIPLVRKPSLPHGVAPEEVPGQALCEIFELPEMCLSAGSSPGRQQARCAHGHRTGSNEQDVFAAT